MESVLKSSTMTSTDSNSTLDDRIGRGRYWAELAIFTLSSSLIYGVGIVAIVFAVLAGGQAGSFLLFIVFAGFQLALTWRFLGYGAKRCHDLGLSGFYQLIPLYPLLMLFQEGDAGDNEYGPNPHGVTQDIAEKVKRLRKAADQGDAGGQYNLGVCYRDGEGVTKDLAEAVKWFRKAADQGDAEAQAKLGYAYCHGSGVVKDEIEAYAYLNLVRMTDENVSRNLAILEKDMSPDQIAAGQKRTKELQKEIAAKLATKYAEFEAFEGCKAKAEKGDRVAQFSLGVCYRDGAGVAKDLVKTVTWFRKAADQGYAKAQFNLGVCYYDGTVVVKDPVEAYAYWNLAGTTEEDACKNLAILEKKLSPEARLQGQQRAKEMQNAIEAKNAAKNEEDEEKAGR